MKKFELLAASAIVLLSASSAWAQDVPAQSDASQDATATTTEGTADDQTGGVQDIIITAQRQAERLQDVPIAVSAFTAENLERQQIVNTAALQQTLPNVTFSKGNFTGASFTIRGIGDLCVGVTCDSATGIHVNDMPLLSTRLFETEFFDLERVEVLRGPQGTLFGRNATSGVVNFITAKPDLSGIHASGEFEYGNYDSKQAKAMFNLPIGNTLGVRVAGLYLNRDGYTTNLYDNSKIDDRDLYSVRGTLSWEPSSDTRLDLIAYYFHEDDNRSRLQKQLCHRDPTGILGCAPDVLRYETTNANSTLSAIQSSREFLAIAGDPALAPFGLGSVFGTDFFSNAINPTDNRTTNLDYTPTYFAEEEQYTAKFFHDFGPVALNVTGGYARNVVDSRTDYTQAVENSLVNNPGLLYLQAAGANPASPFYNLAQTLIPNGAAGGVCQSDADPHGVGVYGGNSIGCFDQSIDFDRSSQTVKQYSGEAHLDSSFDGPFNFLLGGIYFQSETFDNSYYVNAFGLDYATGVLGAANSGGAGFLATPFYRNNTDYFKLKSYGIFGETYFQFNDKFKITLGLRYNHDDKFVRARTTYLQDAAGNNPLVLYGSDDFTDAINYAQLDFDATRAGAQPYAEENVSFGRLTGRAVIDYKITPDNLIYASYSRGYKSGGINPPLSPVFAVQTTFDPEGVNAFEIGSKNTFGNGALRLNLTGFYYQYKNLQLSRIVARTSVNDNVNANIYGVEAEAIVSPIPDFVVNMNASYLHSEVSNDKFLSNPRDPWRAPDAVIIKDITNASNCAVVPTSAANGAATNAFVNAVNGNAFGLPGTTPVPGTSANGAYSICNVLAQIATGSVPATDPLYALQQGLRQAFGVPTGAFPFEVLGSGVATNINGHKLPGAPTYKFAVGAQYTIHFGSGMTLVPRADLNYTGNSYGNIFNLNIDRIPGYEVVNAQIQLNGADDRWFLRGFVQNLTSNDAITGQYVTDQSSGLFTNVFTIEPRRYGVAVGFKF